MGPCTPHGVGPGPGPRSVYVASEETNSWGANRAYKIFVKNLHNQVMPDEHPELKAWCKSS